MAGKLTEEQRQEIVRRYREGESVDRMKADYPVSLATLYSLLSARGLTRRQSVTIEQRQEIVRRYQAGETQRQIARSMHYGAARVRNVLGEAGIVRVQPGRHLSATDWQEISQRYQAGQSMRQLGALFGVREMTVCRHLKAAGVMRPGRWRVSEDSAVFKGSEAHKISAERWKELYWGRRSGYPSMNLLAKRIGCSQPTVHRWLTFYGIKTRTRREQSLIDYQEGRRQEITSERNRTNNPCIWKGKRPPNLEKMIEGWKRTARAPRPHLRRRVQRNCVWCGAAMEVTESRASRGYVACCHNHSQRYRNHLANARWRTNQSRPLIVDRLRELLREEPYKALPPTYETLEKAGATIGAGEPEIIEVLVEISR